MLKRLLVLALVLVGGPAFGQTHPVIFQSAADIALRAQMKADYDANPTAPATWGGQIYKQAKTQADECVAGSCDAADNVTGLWCAYMYQATGTASYATCAYGRVTAGFLGRAENCPSGGGGIAGNFSREFSLYLAVVYDWIYQGLSAGERTAFFDKMNLMASCHSAAGGSLSLTGGPTQNFRYNDTDQITGEYMGMAVWHKLTTSYNSTMNTIWNDASRKTGGYTATAADSTTRRNAFKKYITSFGAGGHWMESWEYNLNTYKHAVLGPAILHSIDGSSDYPEVTAWQESAAGAFVSEYVKPYTANVQFYDWGDSQVGHGGGLRYYIAETALALAGLNKSNSTGEKLNDWIRDYLDTYGLSTVAPWPRFLLVYDPYAVRGDHTTLPLTQVSTGIGVQIARTGWGDADEVFGMQFQPCIGFFCSTGAGGIDHAVHAFGEFQLWRNGEWAITHPLTYGGPSLNSKGINGLTLGGESAGLYGPVEYRGTPAFERDDTNGYVMGASTAGGSILPSGSYHMPSTFIQENSRTLVWLPAFDAVVVHDRGNTKDPQVVGTTNYAAALKTYLDAWPTLKDLWIHSQLEPTITSNRVDYPLASGDDVRVTVLYPATPTMTKENEATLWVTGYYGLGSTLAAEKKWHVRVTPAVETQFDTFLTVWNPYTTTPMTPTLVRDTTNKVDAALFTLFTLNRLVAFNGIQTADIPDRTYTAGTGYYTPGVSTILDAARNRTTGYTLTFTVAGGTTTKALLFDMDPNTVWTYQINAGSVLPLAVSAGGVAVIDTSVTGSITLTIGGGGLVPENLVVSTASPLPNAAEDVPYAYQFTATGGTLPYTWDISSGTECTGMSLDAAGAYNDTPTTAQTCNFTVRVTDSQAIPDTATKAIALTVDPAATPTEITTTTLSEATVNVAYVGPITVTGGTGVYTCSLTAGALPDGLSLSATCSTGITGTPTSADQSSNFTIQACDNAGSPSCDTQDYALHVAYPPTTATALTLSGIGSTMVTGFFGAAGIDFATDCSVTLYSPVAAPVTKTRTSGPARRAFFFDSLAVSTQYDITAECVDTAFPATVTFTTLPALVGTNSLVMGFKTPTLPATAAKLKVDYGLATGTVTDNTTTVACTPSCVVTLSGLTRGSVYVMQHTWLDASNVAVTPVSFGRYRVVE